MSARLRLTLSHLALLLLAAALFAVLTGWTLHFLPPRMQPEWGVLPGRDDLVAALLPRAAQVGAVLLVVGAVGSWLLAGRTLRPLRRMDETAQAIAAGRIDRRVGRVGRGDEFQRLAGAFDAMVDRLATAAEEQRRFAANASHELRTPHAVMQAMLEAARRDPDGVDLPELLDRLDETNRRAGATIEALLALAAASSVRGLPREPVDLTEVGAAAVRDVAPLAAAAGVRVSGPVGEADLDGHEASIRQLIGNLVLNGVRHNVPEGGLVAVRVGASDDGGAVLVVENTGPEVPAALLATATEPFVRGDGRSGPGRGPGLGLAIVSAIAQAHAASLTLSPRPGGGLVAEVVFPPAR